MTMHSDLDIERWANIYRDNFMDRRLPGLTFAKFIVNPNAYLIMAIYHEGQPIVAEDDQGLFPLLPAQEQVALEQTWREGLAEVCNLVLEDAAGAALKAVANLLPNDRSADERSTAGAVFTEEQLTAGAVYRGDHYIEPLHHHTYALSKERGVTR